MSETKDNVQAALVKSLKALIVSEGKRSVALKAIAGQVVALRASFTHEGRPDWTGKSDAYRTAISKVYADAGIPKDRLAGVQSTLRNYISTALREKAPAADLKALGLNEKNVVKATSDKAKTAKATADHAAKVVTDPIALFRAVTGTVVAWDSKVFVPEDVEQAVAVIDALVAALTQYRTTCERIGIDRAALATS